MTKQEFRMMSADEINERNAMQGLRIRVTQAEADQFIVTAIDETVENFATRAAESEESWDEYGFLHYEYSTLDQKVRGCFRDRDEFVTLVRNALNE